MNYITPNYDSSSEDEAFEFADVKKIKPAKISTGKIAEKIIELSPAEIQINGANLTFKGFLKFISSLISEFKVSSMIDSLFISKYKKAKF